MFQHVVMMKYSDAADDGFMAHVASYVERVGQECSGVLSYDHGPNLSDRGRHYTHAVIARFESHAAHGAYQVSPAHEEMKAYMTPFIEDLVVCDLLIDPI